MLQQRAAVHSLRTATQGFRQFEIPTVSEAITRVGLAAKLTSIGSAVGVGLDTYATHDSIAEACSTGREEECQRIQYIEYGKLVGRTFGGAIGGGAAARSSVCLAVSLNPGGKVICGMVAAGAGAYGGAKVLEPFGEQFGLAIYQWRHGGGDHDAN
ncbi:hypothetical protein [Vreelandella olivaria]|uniref:hypothetical protein n=1 Tax=Vreelandella olivaria TaxID=390919 RepID=UPI00201F3C22|nr:hypothetical protein [Halomonas olivaria]